MRKSTYFVIVIIFIGIISSGYVLTDSNENQLFNLNLKPCLIKNFFKEQPNSYESLIASTFLGGSNSDGGFNVGIASDENGYVFVSGVTNSPDFPTTSGAYDESFNGGLDIFISKFNADLTEIISSTFIGTDGEDETNRGCITIDNSGNVILAGTTNSRDFPITNNSFDSSYNGRQDIFIVKLDNNLSSIESSTFLGGRSTEGHRCDVSINTDKNDNIFISGMTGSQDFPTTQNAYSSSYFGGSSDYFIAKFDNNISTLRASTFFGGNRNEEWAHIFLDNDNNVFVGGFTSSSDIPTTNEAYDSDFNGVEDTFVAKFNNDLNNLIACTYLGGSEYDNCYTMNIDEDGNILLGGHADYGFPITRGSFRRFYFSPTKGFVSKLSNDLSSLIASTFISGGFKGCVCISIDSDSERNIIVSGYTRAILFPTTIDGFDKTYNGGVDIFISKFNPDLSSLLYSTFIGGISNDELGSGLIVNDDGTIYLGSGTSSSDFPTTINAYDETFNGNVDCFIIKLNMGR